MTRKTEYDFLDWTSFPSSLKVSDDRGTGYWDPALPHTKIPIKPPCKIRVEAMVKAENIPSPPADLGASIFCPTMYADGKVRRYGFTNPFAIEDMGWIKTTYEIKEDAGDYLLVAPRVGGSGQAGVFATSKFDDIKVWIDDVLIYSNDFSNWAPVIIPAEIITGAAIIKFLK